MKNFGDATTHSFEVWIRIASGGAGTGPSSEQVTISYGGAWTPATPVPAIADSGQNWGAENRDGSSGANIASAPADGSEYVVHTTPPTAGGSVTVPFDITAKKNGDGIWSSIASLTSNTTAGTTQVVQTLTVTP